MKEIILAFIRDTNLNVALCISITALSVMGCVIVFRISRMNDVARAAREEVRSKELNQINVRLRDIGEYQTKRITYLEGFAKGKTGEIQ